MVADAPAQASSLHPPAGPATEADIKSFKDFLYQYNRLSEHCFMACIKDFTSRTVTDSEERCTMNCLDKFLKMTQRISSRFQEYQLIQTESFTAMAARRDQT